MKIVRKVIYPITIVLFVLLFVVIFIVKINLDKNKYNDTDGLDSGNDLVVGDELENSKDEEEIVKYYVDIKGAVNNPGVYHVDSNLTVNDVIVLAGGVRDDADTSVINLAKRITDEMVIVVYTYDEVKNSNVVDTVVKVIEKECVCPNIKNDGCLNTEIDDTITNKPGNNLINLNNASMDELMTVDGIGEAKAKAIIEYRNSVGKFKSVDELKNVSGIGDKLYETIKVYFTT